MASVDLTSGAIAAIAQGGANGMQPVLQAMSIQLVINQASPADRYRLLLSDGVHYQEGILATQMNEIVQSGQLQAGSIVRLNEFICNVIQSRRIIIVINLEVLVEKADVMGEPKHYDAVDPVPENGARQPSGVSQTFLSTDNVHQHAGSQAFISDAAQHALESSTFPQQESAVNNQSAESFFSNVGRRMTSINLTSGAIAKISEGLAEIQPVLQVLDFRLVNTQQSSAERYRIILSDGIHNQQGMLATQMNAIVKSGLLQKGSIVKLIEFICNSIQNRRIIIVINLEVLVEKADVTGEPIHYDAVDSVLQNPPRQPFGLNQTFLSIDNVQQNVGSRAIVPDTLQHAFETSTIPQQESAVNNQSASDVGRSISSHNLTSDAIAKIYEGVGDNKLQPILQVLDLRMVNAQQSSVERYCLLLSDRVHQMQAMLATQLNCLVKSGQLQKGSIIQLSEFLCNAIHSRRILIIIDLRVLIERADVSGNPPHFDAANQPGHSIEDYVGDQMTSLSI